MKKIITIFLAFILAFILNELFVRYIIKYPTYGVEKKMKGIKADNKIQNIFKPYSKYWNVEGGNHVFKRNNLGFSGIDVKVSDSSKYIYVLGSSFVEAYQVNPEKIATSIFAKRLERIDSNYQVINLGCSGHDIMDSYFRLKYFSENWNPHKVILVIDSDHDSWIQKNIFDDKEEPEISTLSSFTTNLQIKLRNYSSFLNLAVQSLKGTGGEENNIELDLNNLSIKHKQIVFDSLYFKKTLNLYKSIFKDRFICVSISRDAEMNRWLKNYSNKNDVKFGISERIKTTENRYNRTGHFNENGNKELGILLYETFYNSNLED